MRRGRDFLMPERREADRREGAGGPIQLGWNEDHAEVALVAIETAIGVNRRFGTRPFETHLLEQVAADLRLQIARSVPPVDTVGADGSGRDSSEVSPARSCWVCGAQGDDDCTGESA